MRNFSETSSGSDKITHHGYNRFYPLFLDQFRNQEIELLEIGMYEGESVRLWREYLPKAKLSGIDISYYESKDYIQMYQVDQSSKYELSQFAKDKTQKFSVILDDGSHVPEHQILTFEMLWPTLKPGGVYIIEDIETSWWGRSEIYNYRFNSNKINVIDYFKDTCDIINREFSKSQAAPPLSEISFITYAQNCVIIRKQTISESERFFQRPYLHEQSIEFYGLLQKARRAKRTTTRFIRQLLHLQ